MYSVSKSAVLYSSTTKYYV